MPPLKNTRHETIAQRLTLGESQVNIEKELGFSPNYIAKLLTRNVHIKDRMSEIKGRVAQKVEFNATRVLSLLTEMVELKRSDFDKPREQWTEAMDRWGFEDDPQNIRSHDGKTEGKRGGWDTVGVKGIKLSARDKLKAIELIGKLKPIDAFVAAKQDTTNILVVSAEQARKVSRSVDRLDKYLQSTGERVIESEVIEVTSEEEPSTT